MFLRHQRESTECCSIVWVTHQDLLQAVSPFFIRLSGRREPEPRGLILRIGFGGQCQENTRSRMIIGLNCGNSTLCIAVRDRSFPVY